MLFYRLAFNKPCLRGWSKQLETPELALTSRNVYLPIHCDSERILQLLKLDEFFLEDKRRKKSKLHKTLLHVDQKMDIYVSTLLSVISMLICLTLPVVALEKPCQIFKDNNMNTMYAITSWIERNMAMIDRLTVAVSAILACVSAKMVINGILGTNISLSPWREQGKYKLPRGFRSS